MRKAVWGAGWLAVTIGVAVGQTPEAHFEVASVKPAAPPVPNAKRPGEGGPGTADPGRFTLSAMPLKLLLERAYDVKNYQISGPGWLDSEKFDILAKVPSGATKEQLNVMLQNLLVERFNLTLHHEQREMTVYELTVGKSGSKLKDADTNAPPEREPGSPPQKIGSPDKEGFPQAPSGRPIMIVRISDGIMRFTGKMQSMSQLTSFLESQLTRPVVNRTGFTGTYDFTLAFARDDPKPPDAPAANPADPPSGGLSLIGAVQEQLGLKLESKKDRVDVLVLDHIEKAPTDN